MRPGSTLTMKSDLPSVARDILNLLLDRYEQPNRQTVIRVRLSRADQAGYFSPTDSARSQTNAILADLERQGQVHLHWEKHEINNWLTAVDLEPERAGDVYALLKRQPRQDQAVVLRNLLGSQIPQKDWQAEFLQWVTAQLDAHRSVAPLALNDPQTNVDLLLALAALAGLQSPTLERTLSVQLFGDSKRLGALQGKLLTILRRHYPEAEAFGDDDRSLLRALQLYSVPEYVPISGPLVLQTETDPLNLEPFVPSIALSADMLRQTRVAECSAQIVVTVENATSFSQLAAQRLTSILVIYTGGFASPTVIGLLKSLRAMRPGLAFHHWGDLDAGGLRILSHLRSHLGPISPLLMDAETFQRHQRHAQPLTTNDRRSLEQLRASPLLADCVPLIAQLLEVEQKLEQEAIDIPALRDAIRAVCANNPSPSGLNGVVDGRDGFSSS
jgi:hypothetical protein